MFWLATETRGEIGGRLLLSPEAKPEERKEDVNAVEMASLLLLKSGVPRGAIVDVGDVSAGANSATGDDGIIRE